MLRLFTRLVPVAGKTTGRANLFLVRHASDLSRARHMRTPPTATTSTEPPLRIPTSPSPEPVDSTIENAAKSTAATQTKDSSRSEEETLYERVPSWWMRWVWVLVGMDIIWTWTRQRVTKDDMKTPFNPDDDVQWTPRPLWQRAGLTLFVLAGGAGVALALLLAQARTITRIVRIPQAGVNQVRVETAYNWRGNGRVVDLGSMSARNGRDETELIAKLPNSRGEFLLGLDGARIHGATGSLTEIKQNFNRAFPQLKGLRRETNPVAPGMGRWKSGPAA